MHKLIKPSAGRKYVDLTVSFAPEVDGDEDLPSPPVRYYFTRESESNTVWHTHTLSFSSFLARGPQVE